MTTRNAKVCNNRNDLPDLNLTLDISTFSEAYIYTSLTSMIELLLRN